MENTTKVVGGKNAGVAAGFSSVRFVDGQGTYHIAYKHQFLASDRIQMLLQVRISERTRIVLVNDLLAVLGRQFLELLSQLRSGREHRRARGSIVDNMDNVSVGSSVLFEESLDDLARGLDVGHGELALGVLVLRINDDQGAILCGCSGRRDADNLAERLSHCYGAAAALLERR